jgi:ArsR family transcriptional regulator
LTQLEVVVCCQPLDAPAPSDDEAEATAALFKAQADPARVRNRQPPGNERGRRLRCEFVPALGLAQATVSHHLKKLTDAGLLDREQRGKWAYFSLNPEAKARLAGLVEFPQVLR